MFFRFLLIVSNLFVLVYSVNTGLWHLMMMAIIISMFLVRARLSITEQDSVYWFKPDVTALLVIIIYVVPTVYDALLGRNVLMLEERTLLKYCTLITLFSITFYIATSWMNRRFDLPDDRSIYRDHSRYALFAYALMGLGAFMYLYLVFSRFGSIGNLIAMQRLEYYREVQGMGIFLAGINFLRFGWIYLFILHLTSKNWRPKVAMHAIALAIFCGYFLIQGERGAWVKLLVGVIFAYLLFQKIRVRYVLIAMVIAIMGLQLFSRFRMALDTDVTFQEMAMRADAGWLNMASGETGSHFRISEDVLNDPELGRMRYGRTYIDSFLNLIPQVVWPTRDQFVRLPHVEYMLKYYDRSFFQGGGRAYSFFLEAYTNFWYLGPLIMGFLVGMFANWFFKETVLNKPNALKLALFASSFGSIILLVRSPFSAILKDFMLSSLFPFVFIQTLIIIDRFSRKR